ncbi:MAG: tetratricopeptide repeat protein [Promethearchaeota archaeon]
MDEEKLNNIIRIAKEHYKNKKYKKAHSVLGKIKQSDFSILDTVRQMDFTLLAISILTKQKRYFEAFNLVKGFFADIPHGTDLILKSKDILSDEGMHKFILSVIAYDKESPKTERQELLDMITNVKDASEKGRFLMIFLNGIARQEDIYFDYLMKELYKFFPNNTFLKSKVEKEERKEEEMKYIQLYNNGTKFLQNKDYENAIKYFDEAYEINPNDIELLGNLGVSHMSLGNFSEALNYYNKALKINPNHITLLFNNGMLLSMQAEYEKAIKSWEKILSINPDYYQAKFMISQVIKQRDSFMKLEPQSDQFPESALNLFNKGRLYLHQDKVSEAINMLKEVVENTPDFSESLALLGLALWENKQFDEATKFIDKSLESNQNILIAWNTKGMLLDQQGKYIEAIECYDKALKINPECSAVLNNKGLALDMMKNYEKAIDSYNESLKLNPYFSGAWSNKAATLKKMGLNKSALECYKEALKLNPRDKDTQQEFERLKIITSIPPSRETIEIQIDSADYCPNCGEKNYSNSAMCPYCGTNIGKKPTITQDPDLLSSIVSEELFKENIKDLFQKFKEQDVLAKTDIDLKKVDELIGIGHKLVEEARYEEAIKYFDELIQKKHSLSDFKGVDSWKWSRVQRMFEEAYALIGYCQEQIGDFKNALENYKSAFGKVITLKGEKISVNDLVDRRINKWVEEAVMLAYANKFEESNKIYEEIPSKVQMKQFLSVLDKVIKGNKISINYSQFPSHLKKQEIDDIITIYNQICIIITSAFSASTKDSLFSIDVYKALIFLRDIKPEVSSAKAIKQQIVDAYMASKDIEFKSVYENLMNSKLFSTKI